jgi:hypothetical protein
VRVEGQASVTEVQSKMIFIRGSGPEFLSIFSVIFSKLSEEQKKQTDGEQNESLFFNNSIIALPDDGHFDGNLQPRWLSQSKNGNL